MPSRHSRPSGWAGRRWPAMAVAVVVALGLVVGIAAATRQRHQSHQSQQSHRSQQGTAASPAASATPSRGGSVTPAAPGQGSSATPKRVSPAKTSCPTPGGHATLTVGSNARFNTIQAAVDAAGPGDTVEIAGGTYHEAVRISTSGSPGAYLTIRAKAGEAVTIDGQGSRPSSRSAQGLMTLSGRHYVRIFGLNLVNSGGHGIYAGHAGDLVIEDNTVSHTQDGGIFLGDGSNVVVACNSVDHANAAASGGNPDAAANEAISLFDVSGFDVRSNKVFANYEEGIDVKNGSRDGSIRGNQAFQNAGPNIYADGASDLKISGNRVHGATGSSKAGITLGVESGGTASDVQIYNNVIYQNAGGGIDLWIGHYSNVRIFYNTIYNNGRAAIRATDGVVSGSVARDNIAYRNSLNNVSGFTLSANVTGDPDFVNLAAGDVRLAAGSPALNRGTTATAPTTDFAGRARPIGSAPDAGAYESG